METWKPIPSDPTLEASSEGRIRVIPHFRPMPNGGCRQCGGKPTKGQWAKDEKRFIYCRKGYKTRKVAKLVCEAFHGPAPTSTSVCMHKDEDSKNNKANNLEWGTQKQNLNAPGFIAYCKTRTGKNNPYVKGKTC